MLAERVVHFTPHMMSTPWLETTRAVLAEKDFTGFIVAAF